MRIDLDAKIVARDGEELGTVQKAIIDPQSQLVCELVISTGGLFGHDVRLPIQDLERASVDGDAVRLRLTRDEVELLPGYLPEEYVSPSADWPAPTGYPFAFGAYLLPAVAPTPHGAAYEPNIEAAEQIMLAGGDMSAEPALAKGDKVVDANGKEVGRVDDLVFDPTTGEILGFILRVGSGLERLFGGGETIEIGRSQIARLEAGRVELAPRPADR